MGVAKPINPKVCAWEECQAEFIPLRSGQKYCDGECRKAKFRKQYLKGTQLRECAQCSKLINSKNAMKRFCNIKCQKAFAKGAPRTGHYNDITGQNWEHISESIGGKMVQKREIENHQEFDGNSDHAAAIEAYLAKGKTITKLTIKSVETSRPVRMDELGGLQGILY
jgi:hypothetical protein